MNLGDDDNILCTYRVDSTANFPSSAKGLENALINQLMQRVGSESRDLVFICAPRCNWNSIETRLLLGDHRWLPSDKVSTRRVTKIKWICSLGAAAGDSFECSAALREHEIQADCRTREREREITRKAAIRNTGNRPLLLLL